MNIPTKREEASAYWKKQVEAWKISGLSGSQFCEANQLTYHRFMYWRQKFMAEEPKRGSPRSRVGFAVVSGPPAQETGLTLSLPTGWVIRGIRGDNVAVVRQLLETLP